MRKKMKIAAYTNCTKRLVPEKAAPVLERFTRAATAMTKMAQRVIAKGAAAVAAMRRLIDPTPVP
jgi:L-fucose isomerase-like protein